MPCSLGNLRELHKPGSGCFSGPAERQNDCREAGREHNDFTAMAEQTMVALSGEEQPPGSPPPPQLERAQHYARRGQLHLRGRECGRSHGAHTTRRSEQRTMILARWPHLGQ